MIFTRNLTEKYNVDVFVAGGGPSGIAAAVSAARLGCSVFLAEKGGCFGGSGTTGLVPCFATFTDRKTFSRAALAERFMMLSSSPTRLLAMDSTGIPLKSLKRFMMIWRSRRA